MSVGAGVQVCVCANTLVKGDFRNIQTEHVRLAGRMFRGEGVGMGWPIFAAIDCGSGVGLLEDSRINYNYYSL